MLTISGLSRPASLSQCSFTAPWSGLRQALMVYQVLAKMLLFLAGRFAKRSRQTKSDPLADGRSDRKFCRWFTTKGEAVTKATRAAVKNRQRTVSGDTLFYGATLQSSARPAGVHGQGYTTGCKQHRACPDVRQRATSAQFSDYFTGLCYGCQIQ